MEKMNSIKCTEKIVNIRKLNSPRKKYFQKTIIQTLFLFIFQNIKKRITNHNY